MSEINETPEFILFAVIMITALLVPVAFILMWGPQRFEKRDKKAK